MKPKALLRSCSYPPKVCARAQNGDCVHNMYPFYVDREAYLEEEKFKLLVTAGNMTNNLIIREFPKVWTNNLQGLPKALRHLIV